MQLLVRQPTMGSKEIGLIPILQNHIKVGKRKHRNWTNTWYCRKIILLVFQFHEFVSLASYSQNSSQFIRSITLPPPPRPPSPSSAIPFLHGHISRASKIPVMFPNCFVPHNFLSRTLLLSETEGREKANIFRPWKNIFLAGNPA